MAVPLLPIFGLLAGAASSIGGAIAGERNRQDQIRRRAAEIRNSPWTGRSSFTEVQGVRDPISQGISGLLAGGQTAAELGKWEQSGGLQDIFGNRQVEAPSVEQALPQAPTLGATQFGATPRFSLQGSQQQIPWKLLSGIGT